MKSNQVLPERISVVPDVSRKESCCTVVHINMAQPKPVAEATLDMIEIMTRAFDESEGGEGTASYCWTNLEPGGLKKRTPCLKETNTIPRNPCGTRYFAMTQFTSEYKQCYPKPEEPR